MSHTTTSDPSGAPGSATRQRVQPTHVTAWAGWIGFAGVMMLMVGSFHVIQGLAAIFRDEVFLVSSSGLVVSADYTTWGWTHVIGGAVLMGAGMFVFTGKVWARTIGVIVAMLSALVNIAFLAAYPVWSALMIVVDVLVIWALTVHGAELKDN